MYGIPGAGKTTFARRLAERTDAVWLNGDELKKARDFQSGSLEPGSESERRWWRAMRARLKGNYGYDCNFEAAARLGRPVIRDYSHNRRDERDHARERAAALGMRESLVVWLRSPVDLAVRRGSERAVNAWQYRLEAPAMRRHIENKLSVMEAPGGGELCLEIDGREAFASQFRVFADFCREHGLV